MKCWFFNTILLALLSVMVSGCCFPCARPIARMAHRGSFEPSCGLPVYEPDCGIASYEPDCGIASYEPDCGIANIEPDCGFAGPVGACGWGWGPWGGRGLFGLWNGWGPDFEVMAAGWRPCVGPFDFLRNAFCCGGCGGCYYDEWACDPPRCCDPCGLMCGNYGCDGGCACGSACGGVPCATGQCRNDQTMPTYGENFHRWPAKSTTRQMAPTGRSVANRRDVIRPSNSKVCDCPECRRERQMLTQQRRRGDSRVRQVNHER